MRKGNWLLGCHQKNIPGSHNFLGTIRCERIKRSCLASVKRAVIVRVKTIHIIKSGSVILSVIVPISVTRHSSHLSLIWAKRVEAGCYWSAWYACVFEAQSAENHSRINPSTREVTYSTIVIASSVERSTQPTGSLLEDSCHCQSVLCAVRLSLAELHWPWGDIEGRR